MGILVVLGIENLGTWVLRKLGTWELWVHTPFNFIKQNTEY